MSKNGNRPWACGDRGGGAAWDADAKANIEAISTATRTAEPPG